MQLIEYLEGEKHLDRKQQWLNLKGGPVKKEVNQIGREGQMKKKEKSKEKYDGTEPMR